MEGATFESYTKLSANKSFTKHNIRKYSLNIVSILEELQLLGGYSNVNTYIESLLLPR